MYEQKAEAQGGKIGSQVSCIVAKGELASGRCGGGPIDENLIAKVVMEDKSGG